LEAQPFSAEPIGEHSLIFARLPACRYLASSIARRRKTSPMRARSPYGAGWLAGWLKRARPTRMRMSSERRQISATRPGSKPKDKPNAPLRKFKLRKRPLDEQRRPIADQDLQSIRLARRRAFHGLWADAHHPRSADARGSL